MIPRCDRCNGYLPYHCPTGPHTYMHYRDDIGISDFLLCRRCVRDLNLFLADCPLVGDNTRATAT